MFIFSLFLYVFLSWVLLKKTFVDGYSKLRKYFWWVKQNANSAPQTSNRKFKDRPFLRETLSNPKERGVSGEALSPELEPSTLPLEGFQVEGLTPRKMVKVQSVLESLRIRIVRDNGKGVEGENKSALSTDKVYSRRKRKNDSGTRGED